MSDKELWIKAYEDLFEELVRDPSEEEIRMRFADLKSSLIDQAEYEIESRQEQK